MQIHIEDLRFQCIIGILDFERINLQDVIINLTIDYVYIEKFINYADVSSLIKSQMIERKFLLLEDALGELGQKLKKEFQDINTLHLKITKPSILPDCRVSVSNLFNFNS
ncbi:MAG: dihydroneopterin aldolase [Sulfurimonas sp.]|jgi:dihydroneopterin aldolase|uniref:dihydroneopterin aldolase n=1 Tax=Sulfurimonas sp. TaxID=2022749 RepID=UPI0039E43A53